MVNYRSMKFVSGIEVFVCKVLRVASHQLAPVLPHDELWHDQAVADLETSDKSIDQNILDQLS